MKTTFTATPERVRQQALNTLCTAAGARAAAFVGLAEVGGRPHLCHTTLDLPHDWGVTWPQLDGRPAQQIFDLPRLWESTEPMRFAPCLPSVFRHGRQLLPCKPREPVQSALGAPVMSETTLHGFVLVWGLSTTATAAVRADLSDMYRDIHASLLDLHSDSSVDAQSSRMAVCSASDGTPISLDRSEHHPLRDPAILERTRQAIRSLPAATQSARCTAKRWAVHMHRLDAETVAVRLFPTRTVPVPITALLTPQQRRIASLVVEGCSSAQIAHSLGIQPQTVRSHLKGAFKRLGVRNRTQLANRVAQAPF